MKISSFSHATRPLSIFLSLTILWVICLAIDDGNDYIMKSCNSTLYPQLCYESLSNYSSKIQSNPKTLAITALSVTLLATQPSLESIKNLSLIPDLKPREAEAISDCLAELKDCVFELKKSIKEMGQIGSSSDFDLQMSNIQTWVSAALTDETTCTDGFSHANGDVTAMVRRYVLKVGQLISIALALVNSYASG